MTNNNPIQSVQPYLFFDGRCEEALEFYRTALGAEILMLMRYKESPDPNSCAPGSGEKIMHCTFRVGPVNLMASDGNCGNKPVFEGFSLALTVSSEAEAQKFYNALAKDGQVQMPLTKTFFSPSFGMVADRFGVGWMIMAQQTNP
jgi:PhnB protein